MQIYLLNKKLQRTLCTEKFKLNFNKFEKEKAKRYSTLLLWVT